MASCRRPLIGIGKPFLTVFQHFLLWNMCRLPIRPIRMFLVTRKHLPEIPVGIAFVIGSSDSVSNSSLHYPLLRVSHDTA